MALLNCVCVCVYVSQMCHQYTQVLLTTFLEEDHEVNIGYIGELFFSLYENHVKDFYFNLLTPLKVTQFKITILQKQTKHNEDICTQTVGLVNN